ncbi:hypothetical protein BCR43DRAFT_138936 [Syncephalastrum racemosum]|uniref:UspA domain-containing protein n=1 Tax=Syncephalastrum racemosum TaxID=13706 RepID=A0A1X2HNC1_SYNRA|nr:hypothetical protein BCR43DRAFT_138936 [Syncephalastrum racemosum]
MHTPGEKKKNKGMGKKSSIGKLLCLCSSNQSVHMDPSEPALSPPEDRPSVLPRQRKLLIKEPSIAEKRSIYWAQEGAADSTTFSPPANELQTRRSSGTSINTRLSFQTDTNAYRRRVSFDNATHAITSNATAKNSQSYVLRSACEGFHRSRRSRVFMVPIDLEVGIEAEALRYTVRELMDEHDEIVVLGMTTKENYEQLMPRKKADELFANVIENNAGQRINITIEVLFNMSTRDLEDMVSMYEPALIIVSNAQRTSYRHEFSGTGIFRSMLKRCTTPVAMVPGPVTRHSSAGSIMQHPPLSQRRSLDDIFRLRRFTWRAASDPHPFIPKLLRHQSSPPAAEGGGGGGGGVSIRSITRRLSDMFKRRNSSSSSLGSSPSPDPMGRPGDM